MSTEPTMVDITRVLAALHAAYPDAPTTKWEVYPAADTTGDEAHLYGDLLMSKDDVPAAMGAWARILHTPMQAALDEATGWVTVSVTTTMPGGVRVCVREEVHSKDLGEPASSGTPAPTLFD